MIFYNIVFLFLGFAHYVLLPLPDVSRFVEVPEVVSPLGCTAAGTVKPKVSTQIVLLGVRSNIF